MASETRVERGELLNTSLKNFSTRRSFRNHVVQGCQGGSVGWVSAFCKDHDSRLLGLSPGEWVGGLGEGGDVGVSASPSTLS